MCVCSTSELKSVNGIAIIAYVFDLLASESARFVLWSFKSLCGERKLHVPVSIYHSHRTHFRTDHPFAWGSHRIAYPLDTIETHRLQHILNLIATSPMCELRGDATIFALIVFISLLVAYFFANSTSLFPLLRFALSK